MLLNFTTRTLKFFMLGIAGVAIAILLSTIFGIFGVMISLLPLIWDVIWRVAIAIFCLTSLTIVWESIK